MRSSSTPSLSSSSTTTTAPASSSSSTLIPPRWQGNPRFRTKHDLLRARRKERIPDASYDLDGDGVVSQKDYFYAKRFDADGNGRLSASERQEARSAMKSGKFTHLSASTSGQRIMQRDGVVLSEENGNWANFSALRAHKQGGKAAVVKAPYHTVSEEGGCPKRGSSAKMFRTKAAMLRARHAQKHRELEATKTHHDTFMQRFLWTTSNLPSSSSSSLMRSQSSGSLGGGGGGRLGLTQSKLKSDLRKRHRVEAGLEEIPTEIFDPASDRPNRLAPSVTYVLSPKCKTRNHLLEIRRAQDRRLRER